MKNALIRHATESPRLIYLLVGILVLLLGTQIPRILIDTDPANMLRATDPDRLFHNQVKARFGLHDAIVVGAVNSNHPEGIYNPDSLQALNRLSQKILAIEGVVKADLMALSVMDNITQQRSDADSDTGSGSIRFTWLMREAPQTQEQADEVRQAVQRLPLLNNTLVSGDGRAAAIYVPLENKDLSYRVAEQIRAHFSELESGDRYYLTGLPVAEEQFGSEMFVQMGISAPLAGAMIFILLWLFFRNIALIVAPMLVAMATVIATMGLLIGLGFTVHIMTSMIPIFLMPIAVVDSVHILSEFSDRFRPGESPKPVITQVFAELFRPMLFTSLTSSVGFFSLMLTPIPPVQVFGAFVGFGILLAFLLTITLIPAYVVRLSPKNLLALQQLHQRQSATGLMARWLNRLGLIAQQRAKWLLSLFVVLLLVSAAGIQQIQINDNPVRWFKADHEIRVADRVLNEYFAGTYNAYMVLEQTAIDAPLSLLNHHLEQTLKASRQQGIELDERIVTPFDPDSGPPFSDYLQQQILQLDDLLFDSSEAQLPLLESLLSAFETAQEQSRTFLKPEILSYMAALQQHLAGGNDSDEASLVGKSNSLADLVKTVNRELLGGAQSQHRIPASSRAVAQVLLQVQSSHRPHDLWHFVTPDYRASLLWLQLKSGDNQAMSAVVEQVRDYMEQHPLPEGIEARWAGKAYLNLIWQDAMVSGMLGSLFSAFVIVFMMMVFLFRSLSLGILAMLPLSLTIALIYGLIGWIGKDYDMPIAILSALTLGLSVDFAIHFIERSRDLYARSGSVAGTLQLMFQEPGRAIARNAIVIAVGFTPLLFSPLVPYITVGLFLAAIMALSALVTLLLLPALQSTLSAYLFPKPQQPQELKS